MIRRALAFAALALAGCAHIEAPPGGPEDKEGPRLLLTRPDTLARMESFAGPVVLVFDEGLSEQRVEEAVEVSPRTSAVVVDKRGDELRINLRRGWERGRIYQVRVAPIIRDRFGNVLGEPVSLVFSTGPEIPDTRLSGRVVERKTAQPARDVRVEAVLQPDSLVYAMRTDSAGRFEFRRIPAGSYQVRAFNDPNGSRALEDFEARDTALATVAVDRAPELALSIIEPDSTAPRLTSGAGEEQTITLRFDDFLDPAQPLRPAQVQVAGPGGAEIAVAELVVGDLPARADSAAADSAPARAARDTARADSVPRLPPPSQTLSVRLARPLVPDSVHRVTVSGVRNLLGLEGGGTVEIRAARARPAPQRTEAAAEPVAEPAEPEPDPEAADPEPERPAPPPADPEPTPRR